MLTKKQLQWIMWKAEKSMEMGGNLDMNCAANSLRVAANHFLILSDTPPDCRPLQFSYNLLRRVDE